MEKNLDGQCSTKSSCKINCKCIITGIIILVLIISTSFFFLKHKEQINLIEQQSNYISQLQQENSSLSSYNNRNSRLYTSRIFDDSWFFSDQPTENIFDNFVNSFNRGKDSMFSKQSVNYVNYNTTKDKYEINVVIPGFKKEDISIELIDNIIVITADYALNNNKDGSNGSRKSKKSSIVSSKVKQSIEIPRDINPEEITTSLENGILSIIVPRNKDAKSTKKIEINQ